MRQAAAPARSHGQWVIGVRLLGVAILVSLIAACGAAQRATLHAPRSTQRLVDQSGHPIEAEVNHKTIVAHALRSSVAVYVRPTVSLASVTLASPQQFGEPLVFVVIDQRPQWLHVLLPSRPNGSTGWIRTGDVRLSWHTYKIVVSLRAHRLAVYNGTVKISDIPAGIGTTKTPTPSGRYYTKELIQTLNPKGPYGPYAYELSGYSTVLTNFNGGDGVIGIHGTNHPEFIGRDVSHGCIRISNAAIERLAKQLPVGVPVEIHR